MLSDLRLTWRALAKSPGFVTVAILTLALGLGVNTAMFGVVNAILIRGLPFFESGRLIHVASRNLPDNVPQLRFSAADFADVRAQQHGCEDLAAYRGGAFNFSDAGQNPVQINGCFISASGPGLLRVAPALGRWFLPEEDQPGAAAVIVLSHALWQSRYQADPSAVGRHVKVNGEWATVIGIGPPGFRFPELTDVWMPLRSAPAAERRDRRYLDVMGRLRPGVTLERAGAELNGIAGGLALANPDTNKNVDTLVRPLVDRYVSDNNRRIVHLMFGAVLLVLLIACANIANLLLARAAGRQKEIAVRLALGAPRGRIVRLLLTEVLALAVGGAALGLPLAVFLLRLLDGYVKTQAIPYWWVFDLDWTGLAYVGGATFFSTMAAGLWPAWQATRPDLNTVLKDSSRGTTGFALGRFTRAMVVGEVMLSCVLLVQAGLTVRTVVRMQTAPLGFETAGVFTAQLSLMGEGYREPRRQFQLYHDLVERLVARPEVAAACVSNQQPTWNNRTQVELEGRPRSGPQGSGSPPQFVSRALVSSDYFSTLGIRLLEGRTFDERDATEAPKVAVVSSRFAERNWPGESALGHRFTYYWGSNAKPEDEITIVGVVTPTVQGGFGSNESEPVQTYIHYQQTIGSRSMNVLVKARSGDASTLAPLVRQAVRACDEDLPLFRATTLEGVVEDAWFGQKLFAWIFGLFGIVALVLATVGLYGVMSYSVSQRTAEIGVRMALGASPGGVLRLILGEGGRRLVLGLSLGMVAAYFSGRLLGFILWGVTPGDPATFVTTLATLGLAGCAACLVPALRALRVSPIEALRCE